MIARCGVRLHVAALAVVAAHAVLSRAHARELLVTIDRIEAPDVAARSLRATFSGGKLESASVEASQVSAAGRTVRKPKLTCAKLELTARRIACPDAAVDLGKRFPVAFAYTSPSRDVQLEVRPGGDEAWRVAGRLGPHRKLDLTLTRAKLERLSAFLPKDAPRITSGLASGNIAVRGDSLRARVDLSEAAFADASGLHAGEKIAATLDAAAERRGGEWRWNAALAWRAGEVFWQPFFAAAKGHRLEAQGVTGPVATVVRGGRLELPGIGSVTFSGEWDHERKALAALEARAERVRVSALYADLLKPLLQGTALGDMRAEGELALALKMSAAGLQSVDAEASGVSFEDRARRFGVFGLTGRVPWRRDEATTAEIAIEGAEILKLPIGALRVPMRVRNTRVDVKSVRIPFLGGTLQLSDFVGGMAKDGWRWRFSGELSPVPMERLTQTLGLPTMHGVLAASIPEIRYRRQNIAMDGQLDLRLFDGVMSIAKVQLIDAFGRAPRLHADADFREIDLELLTRTFDFGTITGRADGYVRGLELVAWEPVRFDARIESSAGNYPRKISQRAVQNISALGGAGAAAAIQRSLLRFFDQFGYEKLGLSCRLRNGVCEMDGIERAPQGYVIVKGGGIPAISVIGYNRSVNWRELVERLKRITQENVTPVVK